MHRLDKDTSGLLVVAKNDLSHNALSNQFKNGDINKRYIAIVHGIPKDNEGTIDLPISRHPIRRKKMAISPEGKNALTIWKTQEILSEKFALLSIKIKTGRTHQIRVHMSYIGHPVVGDPVYGYKSTWWKKNTNYSKETLDSITRQMLHSECLGFLHPDTGEYMEFRSPIPDDMSHVIEKLKTFEQK